MGLCNKAMLEEEECVYSAPPVNSKVSPGLAAAMAEAKVPSPGGTLVCAVVNDSPRQVIARGTSNIGSITRFIFDR
jgi:hypothetical protein